MCCARRGCRILLEYCVGNSNVEKRYPSVAGSENAAVSGLAPRATESCQTAFGHFQPIAERLLSSDPLPKPEQLQSTQLGNL